MMRRDLIHGACAAAGSLLCFLAQTAAAFSGQGVQVLHTDGSHYQISWTEPGAVDVFVSAQPDAKIQSMRQLAHQDVNRKLETQITEIKRPYFLLRAADGSTYRTAERVLALEGGSNFRDLGGYPAADGKHVRWGLLFRSAAMPKLTDADYAYLSTLKLRTLVDLRSVDERQLSPTDWRARPGATTIAVDYPGDVIFKRLQGFDGPQRERVTERLYAQLPGLLRKEYKSLFDALLAHKTPLVVQGSAGQDRTGIAAALILSALGTPRAVIYQDYLLSAQDRRPQNEMAGVDLHQFPENSAAQFLIAYRNYAEKARKNNLNTPHAKSTPQSKPLMDSRGRPLLEDAFEQIEADYGSVSQYLNRALGVNAAGLAKLRALYLK